MLPGIVEIPGAQRGHPVTAGGDRGLELHLLGPQAGQALLAGPQLERAARRDSRPGRPSRGRPPSPRRGRAARPRGPRPPAVTVALSAASSAIRASSTGTACDGGAVLPSPANPSGSCHDWRTEPVRVYFGPGRGSLAGEPVAGVETPEAAVAVDPAVLVADDGRRPLHVAAGPDGPAVAAGVVDERDAQRAPALAARSPGSGWASVSRQNRRRRSSGPRMFRSPGNGSSMMYSPRSR